MAEGRSQAAWSHTSSLLSLIANVNRDPKKSRPFKPSQFNPHLSPPSNKPSGASQVSVDQLTQEMLAITAQRQASKARKASRLAKRAERQVSKQDQTPSGS